jgi:hypothetical protein
LESVVDRSFVWFLLAVLYHAVVDAVAVYLSGIGWNYWSVGGFWQSSWYQPVLIYRFWKDEESFEEELGNRRRTR